MSFFFFSLMTIFDLIWADRNKNYDCCIKERKRGKRAQSLLITETPDRNAYFENELTWEKSRNVFRSVEGQGLWRTRARLIRRNSFVIFLGWWLFSMFRSMFFFVISQPGHFACPHLLSMIPCCIGVISHVFIAQKELCTNDAFSVRPTWIIWWQRTRLRGTCAGSASDACASIAMRWGEDAAISNLLSQAEVWQLVSVLRTALPYQNRRTYRVFISEMIS